MFTRVLSAFLIVGALSPGMLMPIVVADPAVSVSQSTDASVAATIRITDSGFDPDRVTIELGETVAWVNSTAQVHRVSGGFGYRFFLPLVIRNQATQRVATASSDTAVASATADWSSSDIQPGELFTHTFTTAGDHRYYLMGNPGLTGMITVGSALQPDFQLSVSPSSQGILPGTAAVYTVTITGSDGFSAPVTLSVDNLPTDAVAAWESNPVAPTASTTLTIATAATTVPGSYTMTAVGQSGALSHDTSLIVTISEIPCLPVAGATFVSDNPVEVGQTVHFTASFSPADATTPITYTWDFGNGPEASNHVVSHTFAVTGTYPVTLTLTNPCSYASHTEYLLVVEQHVWVPAPLQNGSFEGGTWRETLTGEVFSEISVPENWIAFWNHDEDYWGRPEMKVIQRVPPYLDPPRVYSGTQALQWFTRWRNFDAGFFQQIPSEIGHLYRAEGYAHAWYSEFDNASLSQTKDQHGSARTIQNGDLGMEMMIGIDPNGGQDPWSEDIVWTSENIYDQYGKVTVQAMAEAPTITLFIRARTLFAFSHCDTYWDEVSLEVLH